MESFEMRVGRPTGIDRIFAKNGYGDVLPVYLGKTAITFFILAEKVNTLFPWLGIAQVGCSAEQGNGVKVPALPAL